MCCCAYSALLKVRVFDYVIVPRKYSDYGTILFIGSYLSRLTFPLCYNFLHMLKNEKSSVFSEYIGESVDLAPLLGKGYNQWLPIVIVLLNITTLFNLHVRLSRVFKFKGVLRIQPKDDDPEVLEGREIISTARGLDERRIARSSDEISSGNAKNARDYLSKYKNRKNYQNDPQSETLLLNGTVPRTSDESYLKADNDLNDVVKSGGRKFGKDNSAASSIVGSAPTSSGFFGKFQGGWTKKNVARGVEDVPLRSAITEPVAPIVEQDVKGKRNVRNMFDD